MEVSFGPNETPAVDVQASVTSTPATPTPTPTPTPAPAPAGAVMPASRRLLGDDLPDLKEIILPRLNIVQNIGKLQEEFEPGTLVYNQNIILFSPASAKKGASHPASPPLNITVFGFKPTRYCEKVEGGGRGIIVDTEDEVRSNGGTLDYGEWKAKKASGMKRFEILKDAMLAIRRPEGVDPDGATFTYEVEGQFYTLAMWALHGVCYTAAYKRVFGPSRVTGCLTKGGYPSWNYSLTVREETYPNGNKAWVPVCIPGRKNTDEFLNFVASVIGR
jgi:hypothetical protein